MSPTSSHDDHDHDDHDHDDHDHAHEASGLLGHLPFFHNHSHGDAHVDEAMEEGQDGIRTLKLSLIGLGLTATFQLVIAVTSGSVGLLADTIHNGTDALTALPLWLAFALARRLPTRRYTYGFGRAEDIAGVLIVVMIALSAVIAAYESAQRLLHPQHLHAVGWVIAAALIGFIGNEAVAELRIRTGRRIGSAALEADGQHARIDGFTSLAVLIGALGGLAGFELADPLIGIFITLIILFIVRDVALTMWHRLMDAVDPQLIARIEQIARSTNGVRAVENVRARYIGHRLYADLALAVDSTLSVEQGHAISEDAHHALLHALPRLSEAHVHIDPDNVPTQHPLTAHHQQGVAAPHTHKTSAPHR